MSSVPYVLRPREIVWRGPSESVVRLTEDGIDLRVPRTIEHSEVLQLLAIIEQAREAQTEGLSWVPAPPAPDEIQRMSYLDQQERVRFDILQKLKDREERPF